MSEGGPKLQVLAGRYVLGETIGRGGAATVHFGKPVGDGKRGVVAIKRLHPHLAADPAFLAMMLDEARIAMRIRHANVVATLDVVMEGGELYITMEYVHGVTLGLLLGRAHAERSRMPPGVARALLREALHGLHAAHEATGPAGEPLGIVHRDVSPQNLLVGEDGVLKVVDFGIAKAEGRVQHTLDGSIKGKLGYMPPEQLFGDALDRRADLYAAGVVLWESLVGERLFAGVDNGPALVKSLVARVEAPSARVEGLDAGLDRVVIRALAHDREERFATAQAMADALCEGGAPASPAEVRAWVRKLAGEALDERGAKLFVFDRESRSLIADLPRARDTLLSAGGGAPRARQRTWALAAAAALCAAAGGSAAVVLGGSAATVESEVVGEARAGSAGAAAAEPTSGGTANGSASASPVAGGASSTTGDAPASEPPVATEPTASATAATEPARPAVSRRSTVTSPAKPAPRPDGCDPPFTIDAQGHKRYKRDCLR